MCKWEIENVLIWANSSLCLLIFVLFSFQFHLQIQFQWVEKSVDGVLGIRTPWPQEGRHRQNHETIATAPEIGNVCNRDRQREKERQWNNVSQRERGREGERRMWQKLWEISLCCWGWEPWSSGYGKRLMFRRSWVQIPAPYTGWTFFHIKLL